MKVFSVALLFACATLTMGFMAPVVHLATKSSVTRTTPKTVVYEGNDVDVDVNDRRKFLSLIPAALVATSSPLPVFASDEKFSQYQDASIGFQIKTPAGWQKSEQSLPDRRKIVLFVENDGDGKDKDLMFIAYTPVRDDFTGLGSFGSVEQVGQMTILPKGELAGQDSDSKMLLAESKKSSYYFDYVTKPNGQPKRHFRTIFSLVNGATGGAGSVLVTITVQTTDDRYDVLKSDFDEIIDSYGKMK